MVLVVTDDTNSARDVISIFMITIYVNKKQQSVNNHTLKGGLGLEYVYNIFSTKGQLISKYPFGVIVLTKKPPKDFWVFCPSLLKEIE